MISCETTLCPQSQFMFPLCKFCTNDYHNRLLYVIITCFSIRLWVFLALLLTFTTITYFLGTAFCHLHLSQTHFYHNLMSLKLLPYFVSRSFQLCLSCSFLLVWFALTFRHFLLFSFCYFGFAFGIHCQFLPSGSITDQHPCHSNTPCTFSFKHLLDFWLYAVYESSIVCGS